MIPLSLAGGAGKKEKVMGKKGLSLKVTTTDRDGGFGGGGFGRGRL